MPLDLLGVGSKVWYQWNPTCYIPLYVVRIFKTRTTRNRDKSEEKLKLLRMEP